MSKITDLIAESGYSTYSDIHSITVDAEGWGWALTIHDPEGKRPRYTLWINQRTCIIKKQEAAALLTEGVIPEWITK